MTDKNNDELNYIYNHIHDGISSVVAVSNDLLSLNKDKTTADIIRLLSEKIIALDYFDSFAFYEIKDLIDFQQTHCYPENLCEIIEQDVECHIDNGTFAWALNNINPVVVTGEKSGYKQVLFSLSTKRRIHGMFIANAKDKGEISGATLDILQLILSITIFSIDNLQLTEQLTDYTLNLEDKVSARTKELEVAMVRVEQSNKARSEFLANMSHEIRTPMNGVLGMLDLLKETKLNKKQLHYVTTAKNSGNNMLVILNDILDLSKVESGKLVIDEEEFNLIETVSDLASLFAMELQDKGVDLIVSIDPIIPNYLLGGQTRFWQIVMNLIGNAKKFTESGEIYLTLTLNDLLNNDVDISVSVKDTGIGIAENSLVKIFESFEQADANTSRHYGGTGLGLTLCKKLVKMMGGDIQVKSVLGEGSKFIFNVKMKRVVNAPDTFSFEKNNRFHALYISTNYKTFDAVNSVFESLDVNYVICGSESYIKKEISGFHDDNTNILLIDEDMLNEKNWDIKELKNKYKSDNVSIAVVANELNKDKYNKEVDVITKPFLTNKLYRYLQMVSCEADTSHLENIVLDKYNTQVLVVEDNEVNQMVVTGMLENIGCDITVAGDGQQGLDILNKSVFDIVLMDINMPVLSGCDATMKYRQNEIENSHLPIIALTANVLPDDVASYYTAGMDDYLSKPFSADDLRNILNKWVPSTKIDSQPMQPVSSEEDGDASLDIITIKGLKEMMGDTYQSLVDTYITRSSELLNDIIQNSNKNNVEKLIHDIHSLKGSSGSMGAKKLFSICDSFEKVLRKNNLVGMDSQIKKLSDELELVHEHFLT